MVVDRIERHDIFNAIMLAAVLLLLGFGIVTALDSLFDTVDDGLVEAVKEGESTTTTEPTTTSSVIDETTIVQARPANEVTVRVGNGARRPGVAGAGTEALEAAGYPTLPPKNGPTRDDSVVYYVNGYEADAARVAELLGVEPTQIEPMPTDPGVPVENAQVIAILGVNSNF